MCDKTSSEQDYFILSIECSQVQAATYALWIAKTFDVSPVELERPGQFVVWLELYFESEEEALLAGKLFENETEHRRWGVRHCQHRDWTEYWKRHFTARKIGKRLWVVPPWVEEEHANRERIEINPGLSFGTGEHFTTRFCLEQVDYWMAEKPGASVLDLGCGSGVLSIAAARLGASPLLAVDNDPVCIEQTKINATINHVDDKIEARELDLKITWVEETYDLVFANIYGPVLIELAPSIIRSSRDVIVLSGVREIEVDSVAETFLQCGVKEIARDGDREWCGMTFRR